MGRIGILVIFILILTAQLAATDLSITVDHEVIGQGDSVTFKCNVENYRGSLINWFKKQGDDDAVQFATNDEVDEIFSQTGRYSGQIETSSGGNVFTFTITITDAVAEDSGAIGCGMKNVDAVYANVQVVVPVSEIHLYCVDAAGSMVREFTDGDQMVFNEGDQYYFQCVALGGNPAPAIDLSLGGKDVNDHFTYEETVTIGTGQPGLKQVNYQSKMSSKQPIVIHKGQNSLDFKCSAAVEGTEPLTISVLPSLKFAPQLTCEKSQYIVPKFAPNIEVICKVKADPSPNHVVIYWQEADGTNRSIHDHSQIYGKYRMDVLPGDKPDEQIIKVHIERIFPQMFRKYTFLAQSSLGTDALDVVIVEDSTAGQSNGGCCRTSITSLATTFTSVLFSLLMYKSIQL